MTKNKAKWLNIAPEAKDDGKSEWKTIEQIKEGGLNWTSNGNQRHGKFLGLTIYIWESKRDKNRIVAIRTIGIDQNVKQANLLKDRPIAKTIRYYYKNSCCISCGSNKNMVIDHKNDLYNDERVHNVKTQRPDDFQPLCNACNLIKRAICTKTKEQNKRQPAPFEYISIGLPSFIEGDETFEQKGLGMRGTYWYDVKAYKEHCKTLIIPQVTSIVNIEKEKTYDKVCTSIQKYCKKKNLNINYIINKLLK